MKTTRQRVYEYIRTHVQVTTGDINKGLGMTRANAQHHLEILLNQELIQIVGHRKGSSRGRPAILYGLSTHFQGENIDKLAGALLAQIFNSNSSTDKESLLRNIVKYMITEESTGAHEQQLAEERTRITKRLHDSVQFLNNWKYHAHWEAHTDSPHIILGNCPYLAILPSHPELCEIDRLLLETLVRSPAENLAKRVLDERGIPFCRFRLIRD